MDKLGKLWEDWEDWQDRDEGEYKRSTRELSNIQRILGLHKEFERLQKEFDSDYSRFRTEFDDLLENYKSQRGLHFKSILILGLWSSPAEGRLLTEKGLRNPFGGRFDRVFAFGSKLPTDVGRVVLDHFLSSLDLLSPATTSNLEDLDGVTSEQVVCHSNGFRVAEVLIATGKLKVKKLRVLGGDGVLGELNYLDRLAREKQIAEVSVYAIKGDPIPHSDVFWQIRSIMESIGHPLESFRSKRNDLTYQALGVTDTPNFNPNSKLQVHFLTVPTSIFKRHPYQVYSTVIETLKQSRCMTADGRWNSRCLSGS